MHEARFFVAAYGGNALALALDVEVRVVAERAAGPIRQAEAADLGSGPLERAGTFAVAPRKPRAGLRAGQRQDMLQRAAVVNGLKGGGLAERHFLSVAGEADRRHGRAGPPHGSHERAGLHLPKMDLVVPPAGRHRQAPVRAYGRRHHQMLVPPVDEDRRRTLDVEDEAMIGRSARTRQQGPPVRAEGEAHDLPALDGSGPDVAGGAIVHQRDLALLRGQRDFPGYGRDGEAEHPAAKLRAARHESPVPHPPYDHAAVIAGRGEPVAVEGERDPVDVGRMTFEMPQLRPLRDIPDDGAVVGRAGRQQPAIGREGQRQHGTAVAVQQSGDVAGCQVVEPDRVLARGRLAHAPCGGQPSAVGRDCQRIDLAGGTLPDLAAQGTQRVARGDVPDPDHLVICPGDELAAVGREDHGPDQGHVAPGLEAEQRLRLGRARRAGGDHCPGGNGEGNQETAHGDRPL